MKDIAEISCWYHDWSTVQESNFWSPNVSISLYHLCLHPTPAPPPHLLLLFLLQSFHIKLFTFSQRSYSFMLHYTRVKHVWMFHISLYISWLCLPHFCLHFCWISFLFLIHFSVLHCLLMCLLSFFACMCRSRSLRTLHSISASCISLKETTE